MADEHDQIRPAGEAQPTNEQPERDQDRPAAPRLLDITDPAVTSGGPSPASDPRSPIRWAAPECRSGSVRSARGTAVDMLVIRFRSGRSGNRERVLRSRDQVRADVEVTRPCEVTFHMDVGLLNRRVFLRLIEINRQRGPQIWVDVDRRGILVRRYFIVARGMWGQVRTLLRSLDAVASRFS